MANEMKLKFKSTKEVEFWQELVIKLASTRHIRDSFHQTHTKSMKSILEEADEALKSLQEK